MPRAPLAGEIRYPNGRPLGLSAAEERSGHVLLCQARARSDLVVQARLIAGVADVEIKTLPCRIAHLTPLAPDVMQVMLRLPAVERLRFHAGQYLDVLLEGGRRRSFSIASPPHDSELLELHVRRVSGGGFTERLFGGAAAGPDAAAIAVGSLLRIEGPIGQFSYRDGAGPAAHDRRRHRLCAAEVDAAAHPRDRHPPRHPSLLGRAPCARRLRGGPGARVGAPLPAAEVHRRAVGGDRASKRPHTRVGWVHEAVLADHPDLAGFEVYAAGPPAMIEAIRASFPRHGLPPERLYFDSFDYAPDAARRVGAAGHEAAPARRQRLRAARSRPEPANGQVRPDQERRGSVQVIQLRVVKLLQIELRRRRR